jgi:phosphatidylserine/phosphatidylglycerophosphate/cardiolipin synthase-like enzyme
VRIAVLVAVVAVVICAAKLLWGIGSEYADAAAPARVTNVAQLGSFDQAVAAIEAAKREVMLSAYTISPKQSRLIDALDAAARRGVVVHVVLTNQGFGYALEQNRDLAAEGHAFRVQLLDRPLHLKSLVVDGGTVVALADENFSACGAVLFLPPPYALAVERAAVGDPHDTATLAVTKGSALIREATLIDAARISVAVETESFGAGNPVAVALESARERGVPVALVVNEREAQDDSREQAELYRLSRMGVSIAYQFGTAKGAVVDRTAFFASANATGGLENQVDFGYVSAAPSFVRQVLQQVQDPEHCQ